ncbi:MAG: hypothetical protein HS111_11880 [Kofleriaceae bacterium]|nr:hypothetical protein [Kofleriaceae bacterium]MCL4227338.1 hypothetical protein [Myxococcales bacterium]
MRIEGVDHRDDLRDTYRGSAHGAVPEMAPRAWHEFVDGVKVGADHAPVTVAEFS